MTLEAHAAAAGAGHPPTDPPRGTQVNLAETIVIKEENVFVVCRRDGSLPLREEHPLGVYSDDCRFLSGHELFVNGVPPRLLVASATPGSESVHELTNPALPLPGGRVLPLQSIQLRLERRVVGECELEETLLVHSYDRAPLELQLDLLLAADFEPMLAIRGIVEAGRGAGVAVERMDCGMRFAVRGRDGRHRATTIAADRECERGDSDSTLRFVLALPPGGAETITLRCELHDGDAPAGSGPARRTRTARRTPEAWLRERTTVVTDDELFNRVLRRSLLDVRMLHSRLGGERYYAAGVPWYATLFGRDSLIAATQMLSFDPPMAEQTLRVLAGLIGTRDDAAHDEEPGKVLHELRPGEVARLGLSPLARYYGTVDATPLFLCLLGEHADWSGDLSLFRELRGAVDAMLGWIDGPGDRDGDGLLEYRRRAAEGTGLRNQGWKDSEEGVLDEHGTPLEPPIALVEAQAYALRAKRRLARLFGLEGDEQRAQQLLREAGELRARLERFWLPGRGYYSMGFGADGRPSEALASNQGHLLWATALPQERAQAVRDCLMSEAMFSGWGIRTLASGEAGYNPVGYHLGTVWPHDTAMIAVGLRKYGFDDDFALIFEALLDAASNAEGYRLPELFAGFSRTDFETPVPYPVACHPQAWAAAAIPYLVTAALGLIPDGLRGRLRVRRPSLPRWLNRVEVSGLRVADARVDLLFERVRGGEQVALTDARIDGAVEVVLEISGSRVPSAGRY